MFKRCEKKDHGKLKFIDSQIQPGKKQKTKQKTIRIDCES